jgi:hypothetical protein
LKECKSAANCNEVNNLIINFRPQVNDVNFGSFHMDLPPTFSMKSPNNTTVAGPGGQGKRREPNNRKRNGKKKGKGNDEAHLLANNNFPHSEIRMLTNKSWALNFAGKQVNKCPQWNDRHKCSPRWFLKKYCFSNCPNKESRVKSKEVPATILQKMMVWIKACRN